MESYVPLTRQLCRSLLDGFAERGQADAASEYAQQIPVRVIAHILGVSTDMADSFTQWVRDVLEFADDAERRIAATEGLLNYFVAQLEVRRHDPGDDLLSELLQTEVDGAPLEDSLILGIAALVLIAGVDTTWSAIGSSLWHLSTHASDLEELVADPGLMPVAVEELLPRLFSGDHGESGHPRCRIRRLPHEGRRQGPHELPGRQSRPRCL